MAAPAIGAIFNAVSSLKGVGGAGGGMAGAGAAAGAIGTTSKAVAGLGKAGIVAAGSVTKLAGSLTGGLMAPLGIVNDLVSSIGQFVQLANPAAFNAFTRAMNDTMAVIGHAVTPIMRALTTYTQAWGDAIARLMPVLQPLFDALADYIVALSANMTPLLQAAAPFIQIFVDVFTIMIRELGKGVAFMQGIVIELINTFAALFGIKDASRFDPEKTSRGAAKRTVNVESVESASSRIMRDAANNILKWSGSGEQKKTQEAYIQDIAKAVASGQAVVAEIRDFVRSILEWFDRRGNEVSGALGAVDDATGGAASGIIGSSGLGIIGSLLRKSFIK